MSGRKGYEFSKNTKDKAVTAWHSDNAGHDIDEPLEVDHIVPVHFCRDNGIPPVMARSVINARAMTPEEHKDRHRHEDDKESWFQAMTLFGWIKGFL